jgi:hypothetical protein
MALYFNMAHLDDNTIHFDKVRLVCTTIVRRVPCYRCNSDPCLSLSELVPVHVCIKLCVV